MRRFAASDGTWQLPGVPFRLARDAANLFRSLAGSPALARFAGPKDQRVRQLQEAGLMDGTSLSTAGRQVLSGVEGLPVLTVTGVADGVTTTADFSGTELATALDAGDHPERDHDFAFIRSFDAGLVKWNCSVGDDAARFVWFGTPDRGPLLPSHAEDSRAVRLETTTSAVVHDRLVELVLEAGNAPAA